MIRLRAWHKWQTPVLSAVVRTREVRQIPLTDDYLMSKVCVASVLDGDFRDFQRKCKRKDADGLWLRILQYVAKHAPFTGDIDVSREDFGRCVLSTPFQSIGRKTGERVHDALLDSGVGYEPVPNELRMTDEQVRARFGTRAGARAPGSGSGSGSKGEPPNPPAGGDGTSSSGGPEGRKPRRSRLPKFEGLDIDTKRTINIAWADREASGNSDPGRWRAPAKSIRADVRESRPYPDDRIQRDFDTIRGKDEAGLTKVARRVMRAEQDKRDEARRNGR